VVDRLITLAKKGTAASRRLAFDRTRSNAVVDKLFGVLADRYKARAGGYTRVLKMADRRWGDAAEMALLQLVDHAEIKKGKAAKTAKTTDQGAAAATAADPLAKVRRAFAGKKSAGTAAAAKPAKAEKAAKAPKAEKATKSTKTAK